MSRLILASGSAIRASILRDAGLDFDILRPNVDEDAIKKASKADGLDLEETVLRLAETKALAIDGPTDTYVIGADQILEYDGEGFDKPRSMDEARERLLGLQGAAHSLINGTVVAKNNEVLYRHVERPRLVMRSMEDEEIEAYLTAAGPEILSSVGAYMVEKLGSRLFERIDGDHTAVLGLSIFPLLRFLRAQNAIAF